MPDNILKYSFRSDLVQEMLDNNTTRRLMSSFIWAATPQGHAFWAKADCNGVLTQKYRDALQELLDQSCTE